MINNTDIMTTQTTTPATTPAIPAQFTLAYTAYEGWSGRSYYGRRSGVRAIPSSTTVALGRETERAIMVHPVRDGQTIPTQRMWLPKSTLTETAPGIWTLNRGFCYRNAGIRWQEDHGALRRAGIRISVG
jgi:hypothetical protein